MLTGLFKQMLKIGLLLTDSSAPEFRKKFGDYADMIQQLFHEAVQSEPSLVPELQFTKFRVFQTDDYPPEDELDSFDAFAITGSPAFAGSDEPWVVKLTEFIRNLIRMKPAIKIVGLCFGHQIVGRALGMDVIPNPEGWETSSTAITLSETGKQFLGINREQVHIVELHHDIVTGPLPENVQLIASTDKCEYQGFYVKDQIITFQGHPEFSVSFMKLMLPYCGQRCQFTESKIRNDLAKLQNPPENGLLRRGLLNFILEKRL
ncbi:amidotransferase [Schizosaccharomyces japonicus yFS275]|uniref:Amidotransferase n=1 Tax=Schizosaccharomyces japonicus (strain yFS275 / FY16936) TaxID=402676 RepID=B6JWN3_SCHJY|nr:amidotransferase [Schizosaccharomyces japonicus yFS275]EEB05784.2 amidotransferase [Schizosaccharomyces japonicus yFS275]